MRPGKRSSVRWRIVLVYFMLVFIAMTIVSVFLMDRIESYQMDSLRSNLTKTISESNLQRSLGNYDSLTKSSAEIQTMISGNWTTGFTAELSVVDDSLNICASTNSSLVGRSGAEVFDTDALIKTLVTGENSESDTQTQDGIKVRNLCFPVVRNSDGKISGAVFVRADLSDINSFLSRSRMIFIQGTLIALAVTVFLGFILARSITVPINSVTNTVQQMSQGDFSAEVPVKSDDEIGQLAEMFNLLRKKLDFTLTEISNEKNKLTTILEYMADGLVAMDLSGSIIHVNPAARRMLRIPEGIDLTGADYDQVMGHLDSSISLKRIIEDIDEGDGQEIIRYGSSVIALRHDYFKDDEGSDVGIIIIMQDITERQKFEDMQTDFVANVSHELKTPLTTVKSYTETLLDGAVEDKDTAYNFLSIVDNEADRMTRLVRDLLQLSRLDRSQERMNIEPRRVGELMAAAIRKIEMTASKKGQTIVSSFDPEDGTLVPLDKDMFEQVMLNVLSNSIKYTGEGGRIEVGGGIDGGNYVIRVSDNGIGIPAESIPRIFDRFYRVDKARSRAMGSTGLGLAITKQIVEEHGGSIRAESVEGEGTTMFISFPLYDEESEAPGETGGAEA